MAFLSSSSSRTEQRAENQVMDSLQARQQKMNDLARAQLDRLGYTNVPLSMIQGMLDELAAKSKQFDSQTRAVCEGLVAVMAEVMKPAFESNAIGTEIGTQEFLNPSNLRNVVDINARIDRLSAFRKSAQELLEMFPNIDVRLKSELARHNLLPLQIKDVVDNFMESFHSEITIPLAQNNVDYADVLIRKFKLLKRQFGRWHVKGTMMYFDDASALSEWNDTSRQIFKIAEQRESLERQRLSLQQK